MPTGRARPGEMTMAWSVIWIPAVVCVLAVAMLAVRAAPETAFPERDWTEAAPESQGVEAAKLDEAMAVIDEISGDHGNSQSLAVRNGRLIWKGPDIDNLHPVWSCTKSFLSAALGLLVDDGKITPATPLGDILHDQATLLRLQRSVKAENAAASASVRILIPCLLLVMAVILAVFGPAIIRHVRGGLF